MVALHRLKILEILKASEQGLTSEEVLEKQNIYGFNEIPEKKEPLWKMIVAQFQDVMVYILLGAVVVSVLVPILHTGQLDRHEFLNAAVIFAVIIINAVLGFLQEWRAENAIALLKKLSAPHVKVRRNGVVSVIPARELVAGDIMLIEAGDRISADGRVVASSSAEVDEASLTGESLPMAKQALEKIEKAFLFSPGMVYAGTLMTRGSAEVVVTGIGLMSEIGKITSMVMELKSPPTPLQIELKKTGQRIGVIVLLLCLAIFVIGLAKGMEPIELFFTAISLAVAAVPEGLPAIVTICLAIGVQRMIKKNALIRRLDSVETLGNITVICADKTGTMTQNLMKVTDVWLAREEDRALLIQAAASCNRAELPDIGDPTEIALLKFADEQKVERLSIDEEDIPFTSEAKYMVTTHTREGKSVKFWKGAPEVIAHHLAGEIKNDFLQRSEEFSRRGLRVLAAAIDDGHGLLGIGLLAMMDPPRVGVKEAIESAKKAGIRTVMITGDHPVTAETIASHIGIETSRVVQGEEIDAMDTDELKHTLHSVSVFARVQPAHKVAILSALQEMGDIVSMSGDGVNDAPALKKAHVGVAMGLKGTDIAREAGAIVLTDDNYATIVSAIAEGRRIYDNIKKFVIFLMRSNLGEVMTVSGALFLGMPLPLLPLHILWVNLVTDSFPALALAAEAGEDGIMNRPPRKQHEGIFHGEWPLMIAAGVCNMILSLGMFQLTLSQFHGDLVLARTMALTTTIFFQLLLSISTRTSRPAFLQSPFGNPWLVFAIMVSIALHGLLLYTPLSTLFSVKPIPLLLWEETIGFSLLAFLVFESLKLAKFRK